MNVRALNWACAANYSNSTHMMGKICVHYKDEVSRRVFYAVEVSSSFEKNPEVVTDGYHGKQFMILNLPSPSFEGLGRRTCTTTQWNIRALAPSRGPKWNQHHVHVKNTVEVWGSQLPGVESASEQQ